MIEGTRVRLRAVERADLRKFQEWPNDPEVAEGLMPYLPLSVEDGERWFVAVATETPEQRPLAVEIRSEAGWQLAGNNRLFPLNGCTEVPNSASSSATGRSGIRDTEPRRWN